MIYPPLTLHGTGLVVGVLLVLLHGIALLHPQSVTAWLTAFPRSRAAGVVVMIIVTIWTWMLVLTMDLGEFSGLRKPLLVFIPAGCFLAIRFVDEFLSVRALGMLLLLAAEPVLEAAFLKPQISRLALVLLAYAWIVKGMFCVGMPYLFRDGVAWLTKAPVRMRAGAIAGLAYGLMVLILTSTQYR